MKVYNIGTRPVVYDRKKGIMAIHPKKFVELPVEQGNAVIAKFNDACDESEYKKFVAEGKKVDEKQRKKNKPEAAQESKDKK